MSKPFQPIRGLLLFVVLVSAATLIFNLTRPKEIVAWRTDWTAAQSASATSGRPFLAYFTAEWCGPCQAMKTSTWADKRVKAAVESRGTVKIDVDARQDLAHRYQVESIPTLMLVDGGGQVVRQTSGFMSADELLAWLDREK